MFKPIAELIFANGIEDILSACDDYMAGAIEQEEVLIKIKEVVEEITE